ncbi:MAG: hypothetical protein OHK0052_10570 [Anaerolineales bacterium]
MPTHFTLELIGYLASLLVAISLMMRSLLKLRIINLIGALCFTVYGLLIRAYPVALMNALIVGIDLYYLAQMLRQKNYFTLLQIAPDAAYLRHFIAFYGDEIMEYLPNYAYAPNENQFAFLVLKNMVPAGVFIAEQAPNAQTAQILLDFVIPGYRDFQIGRFVFEENAATFRARGIRAFASPPGNTIHTRYLQRMGFKPSPHGEYRREIG